MKDNSKLIEQVIENTDIVSLVSEYIQLEKSGNNYRGLCPFHSEKTPSFMVSPTKKIAKCMGCGEGGNPITFLSKIKRISFMEALKFLADKANIKTNITFEKKITDNKQKYYNITRVATNFYVHNLNSTKQGAIALEYLHKRNLDENTIKRFHIGLAPNKFDALYNVLKAESFLELDMIDCGLVRGYENSYGDLFKDRIIFPITDEFGNYVGYSGRIYTEEQKLNSEAKYINSTENIIFSKSKILYNLSQANEFIRKEKRVFLYEGFMNVIASTLAGYPEAVCSMGTSLTIEQAKLIKKYTDNVIICYDGDFAGVEATSKAINILSSVQLNVSVCNLPHGIDADEYVIQYGKEAYYQYVIDHTVDPYTFQYQKAFKNRNATNISDLEMIKKDVFRFLKDSPKSTIEVIMQWLSADLKVDVNSLLSDFQVYCNTTYIPKIVEKKISNKQFHKKFEKANIAEKQLFKIACLSREACQEVLIYSYRFTQDYIYELIQLVGEGYWFKYHSKDKFDANFFKEIVLSTSNNSKLKEAFYELEEDIHLKDYNPVSEEIKRLVKVLTLRSKEKELKSIEQELYSSNDDLKKRKLAIKKIDLKKEIKKIEQEIKVKG